MKQDAKDVLIDMTGRQCGLWTVIERGPNRITPCGNTEAMWLCECQCGTRRLVRAADLRNGASKSCGCYRRQRASEASTRYACKDQRLYTIWAGMCYRCEDPKHPSYSLYGGRGVKVCDEWKEDFDCFARWAYQAGYHDKLTLDRIDVDGDYCPVNCRWATPKEQANNRRTCVYIEYAGKSQTATQWAEEFNISPSTLLGRLRCGWSVEAALTEPTKQKRHSLTYQGVTHSPTEWARIVGISPDLLSYRLLHGWSVEDALFKPVATH